MSPDSRVHAADPASPAAPLASQRCVQCASEFPLDALVCPSCRRFVHAAELERLASEASAAAALGNATAELAAWRAMLTFLPTSARQRAVVEHKVRALSNDVDARSAPGSGVRAWFRKGASGLGAGGLILWKFKALAIFALAKIKFLLLGLTKLPTMFSMLVTMWIYALGFGWKFVVGFVLSIYVHEMGHVAALERFGIPATAPMFIPGFGALVRLRQAPATRVEDARIGLAGPLWGLGAALACASVYLLTHASIWAALARTGGYLNLFNLIPFWQLDGSRGFNAMSRAQRWAAVGVVALAWLLTHENLLFFVGAVGAYRAGFSAPAPEPDARTLGEFAFLTAMLSGIAYFGGQITSGNS